MKWYLAKLVFHIVCGNGDHTPQFDEQLRLIYAEDDLHAFHKARKLGEQENADEVVIPVKWKFIDVSELHLLEELTDGAEIYSGIKEEENAELYISNIKRRATGLLQNSLQGFAELI
jgi:hypothetical protein